MKAAIFDLDGTLIDSMWIWKDLGAKYLQLVGVRAPEDLRESIKHYSLLEACYYLKNRFQLERSPQEINDEAERLLENYYENEFQLKPYVREILESLRKRNIKMCVATATEDRLAMSALKRLELDHYFDFLQTCNSTGLQKGNKKFFELAIKKLNEEPREIWVFEDAYHCMQSAKSANLNVVAIEDDSAKDDRGRIISIADKYIVDFRDLKVNDLQTC